MWEIIHWYFMYLIMPNPAMHLVASSVLGLYSHAIDEKARRRDILPCVGLFLLYVGFYINPEIQHLAYQPWWVISLVGLRHRECVILVGGIITGVYLLLSTHAQITSHVIMNIGQMLRTRKVTFRSRAIMHFVCLFIYAGDPRLSDVHYRDFLLGTSAALCAFVYTRSDILCVSCMFADRRGLVAFVIHALEPSWYKYYRNNHFKMVKHSFYFLYPLLIVVLAFGYNVTHIFEGLK